MRSFLYLLVSGIFATSPAAADQAIAEISITPTDTGVRIEGVVVGLTDGEVDGSLVIQKEGPGGNSNLKQGRSVVISRGSRETIGTTGLSMQPGASLAVYMTITFNGEEIAVSTAQFGQAKTD